MNADPIELYPPSRCEASLPEDLTLPYLVAEEKLDGSRYVLYIGRDPYGRQPEHTLLSRRESTIDGMLVDKTENVPHITNENYDTQKGTVLDGEMMGTNGFSDSSGTMNSSPQGALNAQQEHGWLTYRVFDIIAHKGVYVGGKPLEQRREILMDVLADMDNPHIRIIDQVSALDTDIEAYFYEIVKRGGEGLVVKDIRHGYGTYWAKMKKTYDVSCVISGFKPGNGKYKGQIGALAISVLDNGKLYEVGFASGMDDALRSQMSQDFPAYEGVVLDVFAQELTNPSATHKHGRLRHPTFHRIRTDMNAVDCTIDKLRDDLNGIPQYARAKS